MRSHAPPPQLQPDIPAGLTCHLRPVGPDVAWAWLTSALAVGGVCWLATDSGLLWRSTCVGPLLLAMTLAAVMLTRHWLGSRRAPAGRLILDRQGGAWWLADQAGPATPLEHVRIGWLGRRRAFLTFAVPTNGNLTIVIRRCDLSQAHWRWICRQMRAR